MDLKGSGDQPEKPLGGYGDQLENLFGGSEDQLENHFKGFKGQLEKPFLSGDPTMTWEGLVSYGTDTEHVSK